MASGEHIPGKKIVYFSNLRNSQMGERGRRGRRGRKERGRGRKKVEGGVLRSAITKPEQNTRGSRSVSKTLNLANC